MGKQLANWVFIEFSVFTAGGGGGQEVISPSLVVLNIKKQNQESRFAKLVGTLREREGTKKVCKFWATRLRGGGTKRE